MTLELNYLHKLYYDGEDTDFYDLKIFDLFSIVDFQGMSKLLEKVGELSFMKIISESNAVYLEPYKAYKSSLDNLPLKWATNSHDGHVYYYIISLGETQPGRYKVFLESVWKD
jgi:hypothetical protein